MNILNRTSLIISVLVFPGLVSCGLKNYFPDKERDYQSRQEIAPLTIPQDLKNNTFKRSIVKPEKDETEKVKVIIEADVAKTNNNETESINTVEESVTTDEPVDVIDAENKPIQVDFVMFDGGTTRLRINEHFSPVWRLVGKALSRNRIEITSRNKAGGQFIVQYDPDKTDFVDGSIKDEFLFIFGSDQSQEKEYRIRLVKHNNNIEVIVLNDENQPLSDGAGLKLLKLLFSTLHTELTTKK